MVASAQSAAESASGRSSDAPCMAIFSAAVAYSRGQSMRSLANTYSRFARASSERDTEYGPPSESAAAAASSCRSSAYLRPTRSPASRWALAADASSDAGACAPASMSRLVAARKFSVLTSARRSCCRAAAVPALAPASLTAYARPVPTLSRCSRVLASRTASNGVPAYPRWKRTSPGVSRRARGAAPRFSAALARRSRWRWRLVSAASIRSRRRCRFCRRMAFGLCFVASASARRSASRASARARASAASEYSGVLATREYSPTRGSRALREIPTPAAAAAGGVEPPSPSLSTSPTPAARA
mmetsp:Transcript_4886/g.19518  ORF Transcript_4886/g.19518 Transcript_4886/m.19518 type:complete len:302 (-) Transcript_4886:10-915(-)